MHGIMRRHRAQKHMDLENNDVSHSFFSSGKRRNNYGCFLLTWTVVFILQETTSFKTTSLFLNYHYYFSKTRAQSFLFAIKLLPWKQKKFTGDSTKCGQNCEVWHFDKEIKILLAFHACCIVGLWLHCYGCHLDFLTIFCGYPWSSLCGFWHHDLRLPEVQS